MTAGPRARLLASTIEAVQELGVQGAGLAELLKRANASRNSLYQHFPGGKSELIQVAGKIVTRLVSTHLTHPAGPTESIAAWVDGVIDFWRQPLETSGFRAGSFMMAAALAEEDPPVQAIAAVAFARWNGELAQSLATLGVPHERTAGLASVMLSGIEGAIVQSRAGKSVQPFADLSGLLAELISSHVK